MSESKTKDATAAALREMTSGKAVPPYVELPALRIERSPYPHLRDADNQCVLARDYESPAATEYVRRAKIVHVSAKDYGVKK